MKNSQWKIACVALISTSVGMLQAAEDSYRFSGALDLGCYKDLDKATKTGSIS
jgi:hypothetical protein